jgi:hypothetical protein
MLNFVIDLVTAGVMLAMISTGLLVRFVLPPGTGGRLNVWGWGRHDWGDLHFWLAASLGALLVLHVALHWTWVCGTAHRMLMRGTGRTDRWQRNLSGAVFLAAVVLLVGGFVWVAARNVEGHVEGERRGGRAAQASLIDASDGGLDAARTDSADTQERRRRRGQ